jgi:hypothetical protein
MKPIAIVYFPRNHRIDSQFAENPINLPRFTQSFYLPPNKLTKHSIGLQTDTDYLNFLAWSAGLLINLSFADFLNNIEPLGDMPKQRVLSIEPLSRNN